ncbi:MAG: glycosyltransferase family A protein [Actinomycetota bacterium]
MSPPTEPLELSIVLTAHNRADLVEEMLRSLADQRWDAAWDIVLVDNDSDDHTLEVLERWADKMPVPTRVISADERRHLSYARGAGAAISEARSVGFLDDDDVIAPGYVAALGETLREHQLAGPRHEHDLLNDASMARYRGTHQTTALTPVFGIPIVSGGGFSCRRALWERLDGQTEAFEYGGEDSDFSLRAARLGVDAVFAPDAVYHVRHRDGLATSFRQGRKLGLARVQLYGMHRDHVTEAPVSLGRTIRRWAGLVKRLPELRDDDTRLVWVWQVGRRLGHLQGSLRNRIWYP